MTAQSVSIASLKRIVPLLPPSTSILLRGERGLGKSQVVKQIASIIRKAMKISSPGFPVIDRRLSQQTEGDLMGLPKINEDVTKWSSTDWYDKACKEPCLLFLDELNRATHEVMQGAFQIVLDKELNGRKLHPETRVMSAINIGAKYTVNEIDPALLDRFWCVDLKPTVKDWIEWGNSAPAEDDEEHVGLATNIDPLIVDFIVQHDQSLDPNPNADPLSIEPSRRSWDKLSQSLVRSKLIYEVGPEHVGKPNNHDFYLMSAGYVGVETAILFRDFANNSANHVTGAELLNDDFDKVKVKLERMGHERLNACIEKLAHYVLDDNDGKPLTDDQGKNVKRFMELLPGELKLSCWSKLTVKGTAKLELAQSLHKHLMELILGVFNVPPGEAGIGIIPNIPGIFKT